MVKEIQETEFMGNATIAFEVRLNSVLFNRVGYVNVIIFPALTYQ
jgi:hypothetical protein